MAIEIDHEILERACKEIIGTILFCLPSAYKGTVYRIGDPPLLTAERITSGIMNRELETISWGLPEKSDYNPPGKSWSGYMDMQDRPLEAMAWCVERQKSWTSEDPKTDRRRIPLINGTGTLDSHHMEPVLVPKEDLYLDHLPMMEFPKSRGGKTVWGESPYAVVAVIKIHFPRKAVRIGSPETKIIKRLSRALGTDLISHQLREQSLKAMHRLAQDKLDSYNILSDCLRNTVAKTGLVFSLIKLELGFLRDQWETLLLDHAVCSFQSKRQAIQALNELLLGVEGDNKKMKKDLMEVQNKFLDLCLTPERGENWVRMQIEERWKKLCGEGKAFKDKEEEVCLAIGALKNALHLGRDPEILAAYNGMPEALKNEWTDLIYRNIERLEDLSLYRLIEILGNHDLNLPFQEKSRRSLIRLKAVAEIVGQLDLNTNMVLREVLNGHDNGVLPPILMRPSGQACGPIDIR